MATELTKLTDLEDYKEELMKGIIKNPVNLLGEAFLKWHCPEDAERKTAYARMGAIYRDCYRDPYFVLNGIWDTRDCHVVGSRLNYLAATLRRRLHGEGIG